MAAKPIDSARVIAARSAAAECLRGALVHGMSCKAAAPTGIAAANIEIEGTNICAATLHNVFDLDSEYKSNLDFSKPSLDNAAPFFCGEATQQQHTRNTKVAALLNMKAVVVVRALSRRLIVVQRHVFRPSCNLCVASR